MNKREQNVLALWDKASAYLQKQVCPETFEQWFQGIVPLSFEGETLNLGVSDDFFANWLETHFDDIMTDALSQVNGRKKVQIRYQTGFERRVSREEPASDPVESGTATDDDRAAAGSPGRKSGPQLNGKYTFGNFVVGEENRYAYAASEIAVKSPGVYNPLYIYGGTGLGKTHLLQAIANEVTKKKPRAVVEFITCENFLNLYVESIQNKKHSEFRNRFRNSDILLIDDVHLLGNKTGLQEEFFNTFNNLYHANKQIVMTSDKPPFEIKGLEERLVSRFESGVCTEITPPGLETRLAILKTKQKEYLIELDDRVLLFLASGIASNIRRLEGALIKLVTYSSAMANREITIDTAEYLLADTLKEEKSGRKITIDDIQKAVADYFDIRVSDIRGGKRPRNIAIPRMIAMYLSRDMTNSSYPEIGELFGGKNHATIIHAFKRITEAMKTDAEMKNNVADLKQHLQFS